MGGSPLWSDEISTLFYLTDKDPNSLLWDANIPTFLAIMWGWISVVPLNEFTLRIPAALFSMFALLLFARMCAKYLPLEQAFCSLMLFASNPLSVWYAGEARSYSMLELAGVATLLAIMPQAGVPSSRFRQYLPLAAPLIHGLGIFSFMAAWVSQQNSLRKILNLKNLGFLLVLIGANFITIRWPSLNWIGAYGPVDWFSKTLSAISAIDQRYGLIVGILAIMAIASPKSSHRTYFLSQIVLLVVIAAFLGKAVMAPRFWILLIAPLCLTSVTFMNRFQSIRRGRHFFIGIILLLSTGFAMSSAQNLGRERGGWMKANSILGDGDSSVLVVGRSELFRYFRSPRYSFMRPHQFVTQFSDFPQGSILLTSLFNVSLIRDQVGAENIELIANFCSECFEPVSLLKKVGPTKLE